MKQLIPSLFILFQLNICVALGSAEDPSSASDQVEAPAYRDRERWTFPGKDQVLIGSRSNRLNGVYEIRFEKGTRRIFRLEDNIWIPYGPNDGVVNLMLPIKGVLEHESRYFQFPLVVGQKWDANFYSREMKKW